MREELTKLLNEYVEYKDEVEHKYTTDPNFQDFINWLNKKNACGGCDVKSQSI